MQKIYFARNKWVAGAIFYRCSMTAWTWVSFIMLSNYVSSACCTYAPSYINSFNISMRSQLSRLGPCVWAARMVRPQWRGTALHSTLNQSLSTGHRESSLLIDTPRSQSIRRTESRDYAQETVCSKPTHESLAHTPPYVHDSCIILRWQRTVILEKPGVKVRDHSDNALLKYQLITMHSLDELQMIAQQWNLIRLLRRRVFSRLNCCVTCRGRTPCHVQKLLLLSLCYPVCETRVS